MTEPVVYVLDANVFIQAKRHHYRFELCPGFWSALVAQHQRGVVLSIDKVKDEVLRGGDELAAWVRDVAPGSLFQPTDGPEIRDAYRQAIRWVQGRNQYRDEARAKFAGDADPWLIAFAKARRCVVVTHEESAELSKKKVKIPDVCTALGVEVVNTFDMLAALGVSFSWQP